jgi:DamX protein
MPVTAKIDSTNIENHSVTAISANSRIDYVLRFNKKAVIIVDNSSSEYSRIGSLFLGNLADDHNAAYLAVSPKLNDIQIRCRIIEQLFADVLFDPEQALAVSIMRLIKNSPQKISIVVDHAHLLTFKLLHELIYLAQVAKKAKLTIDVVMLSDTGIGQKILAEKKLLEKHIALIDAKSGQLLSIDNKCFLPNKKALLTKKQIKVMLQMFSISILLLLVIWAIVASKLFYKSAPLPSYINSSEPNILAAKQPQKTVKDRFVTLDKINENEVDNTEKTAAANAASPNEIYQALNRAGAELAIASPSDILSALLDVDVIEGDIQKLPKDEIKANRMADNDSLSTATVKDMSIYRNSHSSIAASTIDPLYYLNAQQGYIIQYAALVNEQAFYKAVNSLKLNDYYGYYRLLAKNKLWVLTSKIYKTKAEAIIALNNLPDSIKKQAPWLKPLHIVQQEIRQYQSEVNKHK